MPASKICPNCSRDNLDRYYVRALEMGKTLRMFKAVNLFQCPRCFAFFANKKGHYIMLEIREIERKQTDIVNSSLIRYKSPSPERDGG